MGELTDVHGAHRGRAPGSGAGGMDRGGLDGSLDLDGRGDLRGCVVLVGTEIMDPVIALAALIIMAVEISIRLL